MSVVIVSGSGGLIGSESARFFLEQGLEVVGLDNDMRNYFFGASTAPTTRQLCQSSSRFLHHDLDIRDYGGVSALFKKYGSNIQAVIHTAAQPSHDWAAREPLTDFSVNAQGTLHLLEATRLFCPQACFVFTSTNKVYGDLPNKLPLVELPTRYELAKDHHFSCKGIDETMSIDRSTHSVFGASKVAADIMVQEYGRYFGLNTAVFRGGCLTGPAHAGAELHGFLSYLAICAVHQKPYTIFGYKGKQVRDNIHAHDLVLAFWHYIQRPSPAKVYNIGGSRFSNCSVLEAITILENLVGKPVNYTVSDQARTGDHQWWVSDVSAFQADYPDWKLTYNVPLILQEIVDAVKARS